MTSAPSSGPSAESFLPAIHTLLTRIIRHGGFDLAFTIRKREPAERNLEDAEMVVDLQGPDADLLLEKNAALLDAIEHVVLKAARLEEDLFGKFAFDCKDWRSVRAEELRLTARIAAQQVMETGSPFSLSPMSPRERRIVHLALKNEPTVRTMSEGSGTLRKVVILPVSNSNSSSG